GGLQLAVVRMGAEDDDPQGAIAIGLGLRGQRGRHRRRDAKADGQEARPEPLAETGESGDETRHERLLVAVDNNGQKGQAGPRAPARLTIAFEKSPPRKPPSFT